MGRGGEERGGEGEGRGWGGEGMGRGGEGMGRGLGGEGKRLGVDVSDGWMPTPVPTFLLVVECVNLCVGWVVEPVIGDAVSEVSEVLLVRLNQLGHVIHHHKLLLSVEVVCFILLASILAVQMFKLRELRSLIWCILLPRVRQDEVVLPLPLRAVLEGLQALVRDSILIMQLRQPRGVGQGRGSRVVGDTHVHSQTHHAHVQQHSLQLMSMHCTGGGQ